MTPTSTLRALLALAIALEVTGTLSLRLSDGFAHPAWTVLVIGSYAASIAVFSQALARGMELGVAYATLTGVGLLAATLASTLVFSEVIEPQDVAGMVLLFVGVVLLQRGRTGGRWAGEVPG